MRALVAYESMYGNTAKIAEAIAEGVAETADFESSAVPIDRIDPKEAADFELLFVGGPTHVHGMSRSKTRDVALSDEKNTYERPTVAPGLREWMDALGIGNGRPAAAFDTRLDGPKVMTGSAAKGISRRLERFGYRLITPAGSFVVDKQNVLLDGEVGAAKAWGRKVSESVGVASRSS